MRCHAVRHARPGRLWSVDGAHYGAGDGFGIVGDGVIDGQGGEPMMGGTASWWTQTRGAWSEPGADPNVGATHFTLYKITLHNSPKFHVKLNAVGSSYGASPSNAVEGDEQRGHRAHALERPQHGRRRSG